MAAIDVDAGRILVKRLDRLLVLLKANGAILREFPSLHRAVQEARLDGQRLIVTQGNVLAVYGTATGRLEHRRPLPARAGLENVEDGLAVFIVGNAVHVLRLTDGREAVIRVPGEGPVHAQIEASGLFCSYSVPGSSRPGRVMFVPFETQLRRFR